MPDQKSDPKPNQKVDRQLESPRSRRSLLFVPGAEPRKLARARDAGADTLLLDLEDAVAPPQKADARQHVCEALRAGGFGDTEVAVRVNAPGTPWFEADVAAVVAAGGRSLMLPKAESAAQVRDVLAKLDAGVTILLLIESPSGVAEAVPIGRTSSAIEALCFGHADFALQMGLADADASRGIVHHARCTVAIAAKACGVAAVDSVYLAVRDDAGFREDAQLGLRLGFDGKLCIHPQQVEIANRVYTPPPERVAQAERVIEAWDRAQADARGVFTLGGRMIDAPLVAVERRILERARRAGRR